MIQLTQNFDSIAYDYVKINVILAYQLRSKAFFTLKHVYSGSKTSQISFPLGGIGTGCIGLAGNGRLVDWEIYNRPNKGTYNGLSHFAVKVEKDGKVIDARILNGALQPPYSGALGRAMYEGFGFGVEKGSMAGFPHFSESTFTGSFPIAELDLADPSFPGFVKITAFNPFIPMEDRDSGIPAAFFEISIENTTDSDLEYTIAGILLNPLKAGNRNCVRTESGETFLHLQTDGVDTMSPEFGDLCLATDASDVSHQEYWYRGGWSDHLETYWRDFTAPGPLKPRTFPAGQSAAGDHGMLAARIAVPAGQTGSVRFVISWNFPNCVNYWNQGSVTRAAAQGVGPVWKNFYATIWDDSNTSAHYCLTEWDRLFGLTKLFCDTLFASSIPAPALDAISANISILKTPTVLRMTDGTFYGWEGCHATAGCCEGSCTHVWGYQQALPFLFPNLERSMREADYKFNLLPTGGMPFRIQLPLGVIQQQNDHFRPCVDGQMGGIMRVYRDWKISGDTDWLREIWPSVKASIEFAWHPGNTDRWDPEKTGVISGRQHHTLDMELFGPNSWLTGFYLGALKAGAEMAAAVGEQEASAEYLRIFERGYAWVKENLFNGEYFIQHIDLGDKSLIDSFGADNYWSTEHGEIKYQIGEGCAIDQALPQWHANLYGLGDVLDPAQVRMAAEAIFRNNYKGPMGSHANSWRVYSLNDESGLIICDWPVSVRNPAIPIPYGPETMNGFEYSAASLMIQCGMVDEGVAVVKSLRDRFDGERRNPWNEFECGSNYARSMASYALLLDFSGFKFDMVSGFIGFKPIQQDSTDRQSFFWSIDGAWGNIVVDYSGQVVTLDVLYGALQLRSFGSPIRAAHTTVGGNAVSFTIQGADNVLDFDQGIEIMPGAPLSLFGKA